MYLKILQWRPVIIEYDTGDFIFLYSWPLLWIILILSDFVNREDDNAMQT